jgi:DNA-directed RNA polymerase subunit L
MRVYDIQRSDCGNAACPEGARLTFVVDGIDVSLANALRRIALSSVPHVALYNYTSKSFDSANDDTNVKVLVNTSSLSNEVLLHRLSLIPLCFDEEQVDRFEALRYKFVLRVKNQSRSVIPVTSADFDIIDETTNKPFPKTFAQRIFPANPVTKNHVLISKLKPNLDDDAGEEIHIEGRAVRDVASTNACFSPISVCMYANVVDDAKAEDALRKQLSSTHQDLHEESTAHFNTLQRDRYYKKNERGEPNAFRFTIESECRVRPEYVFLKAIETLHSNVRELAEALGSCVANVDMDIVTFKVHGFGHTIGNLVQSMLYCFSKQDTVAGDASSISLVRYIGYYVPHLLENDMVIRISYRDTTDPEVARDRLRKSLMTDVLQYIESFKTEFQGGVRMV